MKKTIAIIGFVIVLCLIIYDFYEILYKPFAFTPSIIVLMIIYLGLDIKYIFKHDRMGIIIFSILSIIYMYVCYWHNEDFIEVYTNILKVLS